MSTNLYWKEIDPVRPLGVGSTTFKRIIAKRFFENDGSVTNESVILSYHDHSEWLQGLIDGGLEDAKKMLNDLEKHQMLEVWTAE